MKRTNLVLDASKLEEARRLLVAKTHSDTVNKALDEAIRVQSVRDLHRFMGSKLWQGDLGRYGRTSRESNPVAGRRLGDSPGHVDLDRLVYQLLDPERGAGCPAGCVAIRGDVSSHGRLVARICKCRDDSRHSRLDSLRHIGA